MWRQPRAWGHWLLRAVGLVAAGVATEPATTREWGYSPAALYKNL